MRRAGARRQGGTRLAYDIDNLRSLGGVFVVLVLAWLLSERKSAIPWRLAIGALLLQAGFMLLVFAVPAVRANLQGLNAAIDALQAATQEGARFVFGYLAGGAQPFTVTDPTQMSILLFQVFPLVIVISALSAVLWRWRVLDVICRALGFLFQRALGVSGPLGLATAANIFLGMVEAPLTIRPYLDRMTRSELFVIMTTGLATVAGTVMAIYALLLRPTLPEAAAHILVASFMAAPASVLIARLMIPEAPGQAATQGLDAPTVTYHSTMDAFATGVEEGVRMLINIVAMLLAAVAVVALTDAVLAAALPPVFGAELSLERMFGWVFAPLMWVIGAPWAEAPTAGALMGVKTVLNEFFAFVRLSEIPPEALSPRTRLILTYALCGFSNFGAVAILVGGLSAICPGRRGEIAELGLKAIVSGSLTTCMTAAIVGAAPGALFGI